jgi:hypothetical protein
MIYQQDIEEVNLGICQDSLKLLSFFYGAAADKFGVPPVAQVEFVHLGKALDIAVLNIRSESIPLVNRGISHIGFSP